jgi:IS30 family transposase
LPLRQEWAVCQQDEHHEIATNVLRAFADKLLSVAKAIRLSMIYEQSCEMAMHNKLSEQTGVAVYF